MIITRYLKNLIRLMILTKKKLRAKSIKISPDAIQGNNISIGKNVCIKNDVTIDDYTYVNSNSYIENCSIGKYCSISSGVYINPEEHNIAKLMTSPIFGNGSTNRKKVIIGNNVLISLNVIILSGVKIGNGAVIGAGAVVTKDVPAYSVVVGVPAKVIRFRFHQDIVDWLASQNIYELSINEIKKIDCSI